MLRMMKYFTLVILLIVDLCQSETINLPDITTYAGEYFSVNLTKIVPDYAEMYEIQSQNSIDSSDLSVQLTVDTVQRINELISSFKGKNCLSGN